MRAFDFVPWLLAALLVLVAVMVAWWLFDAWRDWKKLGTQMGAGDRLVRSVEALVRQVDALSQAVGSIMGHPYDVACPKCGAPKNYPCNGGTYRRNEGHVERHDASPKSRHERKHGRSIYLVTDGEETVT